MTNLSDRFRNLDFDLVHAERRTLAYMTQKTKEQWKRRAGQEAVERSGACTGRTSCACPNCTGKNDFWRRVHRAIFDDGMTKQQAMAAANREITGGVVPSPWTDVAGIFGDR